MLRPDEPKPLSILDPVTWTYILLHDKPDQLFKFGWQGSAVIAQLPDLGG